MKLLLPLLAIFFFQTIVSQQVPTRFPPIWHTWVVTTVKLGGSPIPIENDGRLIMFDAVNGVSCRYWEESLTNISDIRGTDYCDYKSGKHYIMNDTKVDSKCTSVLPLTGDLPMLLFPQDFINTARFLGVDRVGQKLCNHFFAPSIVVGDHYEHMDVWVDVERGLPCQISTVDPVHKDLVTWAFDGFDTIIPHQAVQQCSIPELICTKEDWVCTVNLSAPESAIQAALDWTCSPLDGKLDCRPIQPGGDHFIPDTLVDHSNWAFNAYYRLHRHNQGVDACNFAGAAMLVPPPPPTPPPSTTGNIPKIEFPSTARDSIIGILYSLLGRPKKPNGADEAVFPYDLTCIDETPGLRKKHK